MNKYTFVSDVFQLCVLKTKIFGSFKLNISVYRQPNSSFVQFNFELDNLSTKFPKVTVSNAEDLDVYSTNPDNT